MADDFLKQTSISDDEKCDVVRGEYELTPIDPKDDPSKLRETLRLGQEALNQVLRELPTLSKRGANAKIAGWVAQAHDTMSKAQARLEELSIERERAANEHKEEMAKTDIDRASAIAAGFQLVAAGAKDLAEAGLTKAEIKKIVLQQMESVRNAAGEA